MTGALTCLPSASNAAIPCSSSSPTSLPSAIPRPASPSDSSARGLIPRILAYLFTAGNSGEYCGLTVSCSYAEVYNEEIRDLLVDNSAGQPVAAVQRRQVRDAREAERLYTAGAARRRKGETKQNSESSRSHAILTLHIACQHITTQRTHSAELSLVDLAGSEKASAANNEQQQREGTRINLSLSHLTRVVEAIADGKEHIPYRDSKLTYLLKPCLEGNAHTTLIANLSDHSPNLPDTINTLRFAGRCKKIKQRVLVAQQAGGAGFGSGIAGLDEAIVQVVERQDGLDARCRAELSGKVRRLLASFSRSAVDATGVKKRRMDGPATEWSGSGESAAIGGETSAEAVELRAELKSMDARLLQAQLEMAECKVEADQQLAELTAIVERQRQQTEQAERDLAHVAALLDELQQQRVEQSQLARQDSSKRLAADRTLLPSGKENSGTVLSPTKRLLLSPSDHSPHLTTTSVDLQSPLAVRSRPVLNEAKTPMSSIASVLEKRQLNEREKADDGSNAQPAASVSASYRYSTMELDSAFCAAVQAEADDVMLLPSLTSQPLKLMPAGSRRASAQKPLTNGTLIGQPFSIRTPLRTSLIR